MNRFISRILFAKDNQGGYRGIKITLSTSESVAEKTTPSTV